MFLTNVDLAAKMPQYEIDANTGASQTVVDFAIADAVQRARTYLFDTYDVDDIFSKTGNDRNATLVNCCADIAIYTIVASSQAGADAAHRQTRYDQAIAYFKELQKTTIYSDLPRREATRQKMVEISVDSQPKRNNYF